MDAGRFDTIARSLTTGASRRRLLQSLSLSAAATLLPRSLAARALDAGNDPTAVPAGDGEIEQGEGRAGLKLAADAAMDLGEERLVR